MLDDKDPIGGAKQWSSGFLPATYQGTQFRQGDTPILHLKPPNGMTENEQRNKLGFLQATERDLVRATSRTIPNWTRASVL